MNEITAAIKKKAEEKYDCSEEFGKEPYFNDEQGVIEIQRDCYTSGQVDAIEMMIKFCEWMGEEENPFMMVEGRWFQACGNSTSWTTEQLLLKYMEDNKL